VAVGIKRKPATVNKLTLTLTVNPNPINLNDLISLTEPLTGHFGTRTFRHQDSSALV